MSVLLETIKWTGTALSFSGLMINAWNPKWSRWGWLIFQVSTFCWITASIWQQEWALLLKQLAFFVTTIVGLARAGKIKYEMSP